MLSILTLYHERLFNESLWIINEVGITGTFYGWIYLIIVWVMMFALIYGAILVFVYLKYKNIIRVIKMRK